MSVPPRTVLVLVLSSCVRVALAQAPEAPAAPPKQAEALTLAKVIARGETLRCELPRVSWLPGGHDATVVITAPGGAQTLHRFADGKVADEVLLDPAALYQALGAEAPKPPRFPAMTWLDGKTLRVEHERSILRFELGATAAEVLLSWPAPDTGDVPLFAVAPGDNRVAYVREHQLWLADRAGQQRQLTVDGALDVAYGGAAHRAEFGIDRGLYWSPDGRFLCFSREDLGPIDAAPYQDLDAMPPRPVPGRYPMAGRTHSRVKLGVCDTNDHAVHWLEHDPAEDVYWTNVTFAGDGTLVVARVGRAQDHLELVRYDAASGKRLATLLEERDPEWIEPEHGPSFLPDGRFLWWSARSGHRHLWLHEADGKEVRPVTKGAFDVQQLVAVTADAVWFLASGEDPRQLHLFTVGLDGALDGADVRQVTRERGTHTCELSPNQKFASAVWSNLETRPTARLIDLQTGAATPLPQPADPLEAFALPAQRMFQVKAEDDVVLYGHVAVPPGLAEGQKCPVLLYVYGGPHVQLVTDEWFGGAPLWLQALAAEGYVVCRLDNRGTPHRGIDFEQAVFRKLGVLEVQDQMRAVEWLQKQPFVDGARIGVHGWSYGGYLTLRLLLAAPTTFACGVAGAPVTDWAMYETGYTERYMDTPAENADGYAVSSCLPFVDRLQRPLLVVHGTDDRTVLWSHSLRFVDRCVDAGKKIDYFPYPMQTHKLVGKDRVHFLELLYGYLERHLKPAAK